MLPRTVVTLRHAQSIGNVVTKQGKKGDVSGFTPEFMDNHSHTWKLTEEGRRQAHITGDWLKAQNYTRFDRYYTSEHRRAVETAVLLDLPEASWFLDPRLRERDYGVMDVAHPNDRNGRFAENVQLLKRSPFYGRPAQGESMAELSDRLQSGIIDTLHRENSDHSSVIIVSHGEVMWGFRMRFERLSVAEFDALDRSKHPHNQIHNCQVLEYTRVNPENPKDVRKSMQWMRSVCPWDTARSSNIWKEIVRKRYSNTDLRSLYGF